MRRISKWIPVLPTIAVLLALLSLAKIASSQVSPGSWVTAGAGDAFLSSPRMGAATVLLPDGRLLITGGDNGNGAIASADLSDSSGSVVSAGTMNVARHHHTATLLQDGTVLVAGGVSNGAASNAAEIYHPTSGTWTTTTSAMLAARSGHTSTLLNDGTVLIVGGVSGGSALNTVEIYNPATGTFSFAKGLLSSPREAHAAALLHDGRVLIVGGWDGTTQAAVPPSTVGVPNVLATTDIYDPATGTITDGPTLNVARMNHTATTQLDGKVFVVGGNSGSVDLISAEVLDPTITPPPTSFSMAGVSLATARSNHLAFLLPHNGGTLIVGGTAGGTAIASSELYFPVYLSQAESATMTPTKPMNLARAYATGGAFSSGAVNSVNDGVLLVTGGANASGTPLASAEFFGFSWVKTDALDYAPGTPVNITGGGFQPGETVTLHLQETPYFDSHPDLTAVVQADGTFSSSQFAPDVHDISIGFYLTATGSASGAQAQTMFADGTPTLQVSGQGTGSGTVTSSDTNINCTITGGTASGTCSYTYSANFGGVILTATSKTGSTFTGWSGGCSGTGTCTASASGGNTFAATATFTQNAPSITSAISTTFTEGSAGTFTVTATGVPAPTLSEAGTLPTGIAFNAATGVLSGTATSFGTYSITFTASNGISPAAQQSFTLTVLPTVNAGASTVSASPTSVTADGTATSTITVTLLDANGHAVNGKTVTLTAGSGSSTVTTVSGTTDVNGHASFTVKDTKAGSVTYTAKDSTDNVTIAQTAQVSFTAGTPTTGKSTVVANPTSVTADGATTSTITVTLLDANSNPVSGKTVTLGAGSGSSTIATLSGTTNATGQATFSVKDTKAELVTFTATDTTDSVTVTQTAQVTFTAGAIAKFVFSAISSPQTAGTAFNVTITAQDAFGNTATSYTGSSDKATISSTGTLSGGSITTQPFTNGVVVQSVTITNTGSFTITAVGNGAGGSVSGTSNSFTVNGGAATHFAVSGPATATAGTPSSFTVTALDAFGNTATNYLGTVKFTSSDGQASLPASYAFATSDNGTHTFSGTFKTAGNQTITAVDTVTSSISGTSGNIAVAAGPAASITATAGTPQSTTINTAFATNLAAKVVDAYGNPVSGVTVTFAAAVSGASGSFAGGINTASTNSSGVATAAVFTANGTAGQYSVTATTTAVSTPASFSLTNNNPVPTLAAISPTSGTLTKTLNVVLTGTNFVSGVTTVSLGADIAVNSVTVNSNTQITLNITIPATASLGAHTVSVSNPAPGGGTASLPGAFTVVGTPPQITSAASATFTAGAPGAFTVTSSGNPTASLSAVGSLPGGVTFKDNGDGTATIAGTTTAAGSYPITITAQNGITPNATQVFTLTVNPGALASITLNPASQSIAAGGSAPFTATGYDQYGNKIGDVTSATIFTVANGSCTLNSCGSTLAGPQTVTGNDSGVKSTATLIVQAGAITHLALTPSSASIVAGASQAYSAIGLDAYNNAAGDVTSSTTFGIAPNGSCTGASCTANVADASSSTHAVTGTYAGTGAQGIASLTVTAGTFSQLQLLVPGETAAPGTANGKTGNPNVQYVNGQFHATVNAVDQYWNVVSSVNDTIQITSNDGKAVLPANAALASGTGTFNVTLQTVSYSPAKTTLTAADVTNSVITASTSPAVTVIAVYTAAISPVDWAAGQAGSYTLTVNNSAAPNTNNLGSVQVAIPANDQGAVSNVSVVATQPGGATANWVLDSSQLPGALRFHAVGASDVITPGGAIAINFTATSNAVITNVAIPEVWTTVAYSDLAFASALPLASAEPTVNIGAAPQITSTNSTNSFTYGTPGTAFTVTTTGVPTPTLSTSGSLPSWATFKDNGDGTATISGTPNAAGPSIFTIKAHNGYGNDATQSFTLTVNQATLTVTADPQAKVYGATDPTLTYAASGFKFSDTTATVLTGSLIRATGENVNTSPGYAITQGSLASNGNYTISFTGNFLTITPATLTVKADPQTKMYGGTDPTLTYAASGFKFSDTTATVLTGSLIRATGENVSLSPGYAITQGSLASNGNYTISFTGNFLTITPATLTVKADPQTKMYGGTDPTLTYAASGFQFSDTASVLSGTLTRASGENVGNYAITQGSLAATSNYTINFTASSLTIKPATLTISANSQTKVYGQNDPALTYATSGLQLSDTISVLTGSLTRVGGENVGNYAISQGSLVANSNYTINFIGSSLSITPATLMLNLTGGGGVYTSLPYGAACSVATGLVKTDTVTLTVTYSSGAAPVNVGSYTSTCTSSGNPNYQTATAQTAIVITPAMLTVTAVDQSMTFGGTTPSFTANYKGLQGTDTSSVVSGLVLTTYTNSTLNTAVTNFQTLKAGNYPIVPSGATALNYLIQYANGNLTVNKAVLTGSVTITPADPATVPYGQPATANVYLNSYNIGGVDVLQAHNDPTNPNNPNNPLPPSLTVYLIPSGGVPSQAFKFGTGTAVPTYDNTTSTTGTTKTGWTVAVTGAAPPPGKYNAVVYGDDPGDNSLKNLNLADAGYFYTDAADITYPTLSSNLLNVVPAKLTITAKNTSKTYGQTVTFTGNEFNTSGLVTGDAVTSVTLASAGAPATATVTTPGPAYAIVASAAVGTGLNNYDITYTSGTLTVQPATLKITAKDASKTYGQALTFAGTEFASSALLNGDTVSGVSLTSSGAPATATVTSPGPAYTIVPSAATGTGLGNYTISYANGTLTVNPASLTITAKDISKTYGQAVTFAGTEFMTNGLANADSVTTVTLASAGSPAAATVASPGPTYVIIPSLAVGNGLGNYTINYFTGTLTVSPAPASVTPNVASKVYGTADPALTGKLTGFLTVDAVNASYTRTAGETVLGGPYTISATLSPSSVLANYQITYNTAQFTISAAPASVVPNAAAKVYGTTDPILTGTLTGFLAADGVTPTYSRTTGETVTGGPYTISGTLSPAAVLSNYKIAYKTANFTITPAPLSATVSVSQPNPAVPTSAYQYSDPAVITVSFPVTGPMPNLTGATATVSFGAQTFSGLTFSCNSAIPVVCTASTAAPPDAKAVYMMQSPGTYTVSVVGYSGFDTNFAINKPTTNFSIVQEDAAVTYMGNTYFSVASTQTTVNIPVNFTLQDATATGTGSPIYDSYPGDITKTGNVTITLTGSYINANGTLTNLSPISCTNVILSPTGPTGSNGLSSTAGTGSCIFPGVPVNGIYQATIAPGSGSYYTFPGGYDTSVTIGTSNGGGSFITGGGYQSAKYLNSSPINSSTAPAGYLLGGNALAAKMNFGYVAKYNKSGSNLQASVNVIVRTHCMSTNDFGTLGISTNSYTPKPGDDGLCAYQIKSNKVISMSDTAFLIACTATSTSCTPGYGVLVVGANVQDVTWPNAVSLAGNLQLQLTMFDNGEPGSSPTPEPDTLTLQLNDGKGNLWFANSWSGTKTVIQNGPATSTVGQYAPIIQGGNLQVH